MENKLYLNIQQQVEKNRVDIQSIMQGATVLADFGIKVIGHVDDSSELPDPATYLEEEGTAYGDAYAVGTEAPYDFYIFTRAFPGEEDPSWFNIGEFPLPGPQGPAGQDGATGSAGRGIQSITKIQTSGLEDTYQITYTDGSFFTYVVKNGANGQAAGFGIVYATIDANQGTPSVDVESSGPNSSKNFTFRFHNLKGPTGPQGEPGAFFVIAGQVANESLLPAASEVATTQAYLVGGAPPYNVYAIMSIEGVHEWINLGPVATQESDTKVGSTNFSASGTLTPEVLSEIVNTATADFIKIGDRYFVKQSAGHYYAMKRDSGQVLVYCMDIDLTDGTWVITTETICDLDSEQTLNADKTLGQKQNDPNFSHRLKFTNQTANGYIELAGNNFAINRTLEVAGDFIPDSNNARNVGSSNRKIKDIYLAGKININASNYGLTFPDTSNFTANKEIGTTDQIAIKYASLSNPLTVEQRDILSNNVVVLKTALSSLPAGTIIFPSKDYNVYKHNICIYQNKITQLEWYTANGVYNIRDGGFKFVDGKIYSNYLNGKSIPAYPTTNTERQALVIGANGGNLAFENFPHLYKHIVSITNGLEVNIYTFISSSGTAVDSEASLKTLAYNSMSKFIGEDDFKQPIIYFDMESAGTVYADYVYNGSIDQYNSSISSGTVISDTVSVYM